MKEITGIGGIFFKCKNPGVIKEWYSKNLGLATNEYGSTFEWIDAKTNKKAYTQWSAYDHATKYFEQSSKEFMINYCVDDIEELVKGLKLNGVNVLDEIE